MRALKPLRVELLNYSMASAFVLKKKIINIDFKAHFFLLSKDVCGDSSGGKIYATKMVARQEERRNP